MTTASTGADAVLTEPLGDQQSLSEVYPSNYEQYLVELVNRV